MQFGEAFEILNQSKPNACSILNPSLISLNGFGQINVLKKTSQKIEKYFFFDF